MLLMLLMTIHAVTDCSIQARESLEMESLCLLLFVMKEKKERKEGRGDTGVWRPGWWSSWKLFVVNTASQKAPLS